MFKYMYCLLKLVISLGRLYIATYVPLVILDVHMKQTAMLKCGHICEAEGQMG